MVKAHLGAPLAALLLMAADPAAVQQVPADAAVAILGQTVDGMDGKEMARLVDVLVDAAGRPVAAVIDFGGFLGVGNRKIAVSWNSLKFTPADKDHPIKLTMTMDQIRAAPAYKQEQATPMVTQKTQAAGPPPPAAGPPAAETPPTQAAAPQPAAPQPAAPVPAPASPAPIAPAPTPPAPTPATPPEPAASQPPAPPSPAEQTPAPSPPVPAAKQ